MATLPIAFAPKIVIIQWGAEKRVVGHLRMGNQILGYSYDRIWMDEPPYRKCTAREDGCSVCWLPGMRIARLWRRETLPTSPPVIHST